MTRPAEKGEGMAEFLPLGQSEFSAIRESGSIYVDKTRMIAELAAQPGAKVFLARPRGFGKSLLVSAFDALFSRRMELFKGLAAETLWKDEKSYPVLRLDFSRVRVFTRQEDFRSKLDALLRERTLEAGLEYEAGGNPFASFSRMLSRLRAADEQIVLLIDDYDAPFAAHQDRPELAAQVCDALSGLYSTVKSYDGVFRFVFITGIARFSQTRLFSSFNCQYDITLLGKYSALLGFTEEETAANFTPFLEKAGECLNLSPEELMDSLRRHYGGYCFDEDVKTHVLSPWPVLNFLDDPENGFWKYWFLGGGCPSQVRRLLKEGGLGGPESYAKTWAVTEDQLWWGQEGARSAPLELFFQAGCLTLKGRGAQGEYFLGYPNQEVSESMGWLYADEMTGGNRLRATAGLDVRGILSAGRPEELARLFNQMFNAIDCARYPVRDEASCRAFLQVLMLGAGLKPEIEVRSALGRSDLEVELGAVHWVFELKFARKGEDEAPLLDAALRQLADRRYGETPHGKALKRLALVFSEEKRGFTAWKEEA